MTRNSFAALTVILSASLLTAVWSEKVEEVAVPLPIPQPTQGSDAPSYNSTVRSIVLKGFEDCTRNSYQHDTSVNWKTWIIDGFEEHTTMSMPTVVLDPYGGHIIVGYPDVDWNSAQAIEFLGPAYKNKAYRADIQRNLNEHASMNYAWFFGKRIHVRCDDPANACLHTPDGSIAGAEAYTITTFDDDSCSPFKNHINFCPAYFRRRKLEDALLWAVFRENKPQRNFIRNYWNRAGVWAHELMHISWIADSIGTREHHMRDIQILNFPNTRFAYRPIDLKYLSYSDFALPTDAFNNPQNYAYFMVANYVQSIYDWYPSFNVWSTTDDPPPPPANLAHTPTVSAARSLTCSPTLSAFTTTSHSASAISTAIS